MPDNGWIYKPEYDLVNAFLDADFYLNTYPDVTAMGMDPVVHYLEHGWKLKYDPNPDFSTEAYLARHPDVESCGQNPLVHYARHGFVEGRNGTPSQVHAPNVFPAPPAAKEITPSIRSETASIEYQRSVIGNELDAGFYAAGLQALGIDPLGLDFPAHYIAFGAEAGLAPVGWFSGANYLAANPDVAEEGLNPFYHYLEFGRKEDRPLSASSATAVQSSSEAIFTSELHLLNSEFDQHYYLSEHPELRSTDVTPLLYFITQGWKRGHNPNAKFSTIDYLNMYPDVVESGLNPFVHYLQTGRAEGRKPQQKLGFRYNILKELVPLEDRLKSAYYYAPRHDEKLSDHLISGLTAMTRSKERRLFLSVSHDDFTRNLGGVQLCLQREAAAIRDAQFDHLHLFPATPLPTLEVANLEPLVGVLINGELAGYFTPTSIVTATETARLGDWETRTFALHNLLGHNADAIARILHGLKMRKGFFWVHDFTAGCSGVHLMRNDVQFCGAPALDSAACKLCVYRPYRPAHLDAHRALFEAFDLTLISPSSIALEIWSRATSRSVSGAHVHPHCRLIDRNDGVPPPVYTHPETPLRVGFIGLPMPHKGWPVFDALARVHARDPRYRFFHFGARTEPSAAIEYIKVAASADGSNQMMCALEQYGVDVVVLWSICPETFCLTAYEAAASGAALIATRDGGNAASFVSEGGHGLMLETEHDLEALFATGEVARLSRARRGEHVFQLQYSKLTADFLAKSE